MSSLPRAQSDHGLVVGGTGMLRGVCLGLASQGHQVSVLARSHSRLASLAAQANPPGSIHPLSVDYADAAQLGLSLRTATAACGRISLAVCWIHSHAEHALRLIADMIADDKSPPRFFHILGSSAADPSGPEFAAADLRIRQDIRYRRVVLGFKVEQTGSRWLTDAEICEGVLRAITSDAAESLVGAIHPWAARP